MIHGGHRQSGWQFIMDNNDHPPGAKRAVLQAIRAAV